MVSCCGHDPQDSLPIGTYRRVLWVVLVINAFMFVTEMTAGVWGKSVALQADALDFLGDSATYAMTLIVLGMGLRWRSSPTPSRRDCFTGIVRATATCARCGCVRATTPSPTSP